MEKTMLIAGFGGQGVQTLGKLLSYAANEEDKCVMFAPSYGGEMRGGTSNCTVIIGDRTISSPNKKYMDVVTVLNEASFQKFTASVRPGGTLIVNESLIKSEMERKDITVVKVPFSEMTAQLGSEKSLNVVVLGFLCEYLGVVSNQSASHVVAEKLGKKESFRKMNEEAFLAGTILAKQRKGTP